MTGRHVWALTLASACLIVGQLPTAGAATGSSLGYRIYNYSGETLRLAEIRGEKGSTPPVFDQSATAPVAPKVGDELRPGDTLHVELHDQTGNGARLLWRRAGNTPSTDVAIHLNGDERNSNGSHFSQCSTTSTFACADRTDSIVVLDHPGTVRTLGAAHPEQQAAILSVFCRGKTSQRG